MLIDETRVDKPDWWCVHINLKIEEAILLITQLKKIHLGSFGFESRPYWMTIRYGNAQYSTMLERNVCARNRAFICISLCIQALSCNNCWICNVWMTTLYIMRALSRQLYSTGIISPTSLSFQVSASCLSELDMFEYPYIHEYKNIFKYLCFRRYRFYITF